MHNALSTAILALGRGILPVSLGWVVLTAAVLQFGGWVPKH